MPKTLCSLVSLAVLLVLLPGTAAAQNQSPDPRDLERLRRQITDITKKIEAQQSEQDKEIELLAQSEIEISSINSKLLYLSVQEQQALETLQKLKTQQAQLTGEVELRRRSTMNLIRATYQAGGDSLFKVLLNQQQPGDISRMRVYYQYLSRYRSEQIESFQRSMNSLQTVEKEVGARSQEIAKLVENARQTRKQLAERQQRRQQLIAAIEAQLDSDRKQVKRLQSDERRLLKLLEELATLDKAELSLKQSLVFTDMKGKLKLPASGRITAKFGETKGQGDLKWQGLFLATPVGGEVRSVFRGQVIFADQFRGFGLMMIIDHGEGYMSLYSHNDRLLRQLGDWVEAEEVIAQSGNTGGLKRPGLYFEIRYKGRPSDPLIWCRRS